MKEKMWLPNRKYLWIAVKKFLGILQKKPNKYDSQTWNTKGIIDMNEQI